MHFKRFLYVYPYRKLQGRRLGSTQMAEGHRLGLVQGKV